MCMEALHSCTDSHIRLAAQPLSQRLSLTTSGTTPPPVVWRHLLDGMLRVPSPASRPHHGPTTALIAPSLRRAAPARVHVLRAST